MKGIIAEIYSSYMIVITKNGDFIKCKKTKNCNIGDEIIIPARSMKSVYKKLSALAASFLILIMLSSGVYAYYTPYSYISIDINPSMELYVNRFDRVIGVHAFNEEAQQVIDASEKINNKNVDAALKQILDVAAEAGYLKEDTENSVMIVVSSSNSKEEAALTNKITKTSTAVLSNISNNYEVILEKTKIDNYKKAKEQNISPGKVILANQLKKVKPEINEEETIRMPLQQAIKQIEDKAEKDKKDDGSKKPLSVTNENPRKKTDPQSNVMNIKELIKEKNKELGNKLENEDKDNNREPEKLKNKDDKNKSEKDESINQSSDEDDEDKKKEIEKQNDESSQGKNDDESSKDKDNKKKD